MKKTVLFSVLVALCLHLPMVAEERKPLNKKDRIIKGAAGTCMMIAGIPILCVGGSMLGRTRHHHDNAEVTAGASLFLMGSFLVLGGVNELIEAMTAPEREKMNKVVHTYTRLKTSLFKR